MRSGEVRTGVSRRSLAGTTREVRTGIDQEQHVRSEQCWPGVSRRPSAGRTLKPTGENLDASPPGTNSVLASSSVVSYGSSG